MVNRRTLIKVAVLFSRFLLRAPPFPYIEKTSRGHPCRNTWAPLDDAYIGEKTDDVLLYKSISTGPRLDGHFFEHSFAMNKLNAGFASPRGFTIPESKPPN